MPVMLLVLVLVLLLVLQLTFQLACILLLPSPPITLPSCADTQTTTARAVGGSGVGSDLCGRGVARLCI